MVSGSADKSVKFWEFSYKTAGDENVSPDIICPLNHRAQPPSLNKVAKRKFVDAGTHSDTEDDRRRAVSQVQSKWKVTGGIAAGFDCKSLLSGFPKVLPHPIRAQSTCMPSLDVTC